MSAGNEAELLHIRDALSAVSPGKVLAELGLYILQVSVTPLGKSACCVFGLNFCFRELECLSCR